MNSSAQAEPVINCDFWSSRGQFPQLIMWDLDGTISDSARSILASLQFAFTAHGLPSLDDATARSLLGPPFHESLPPLIGDVPFESVRASYRKCYDAGAALDTVVYPGLLPLLAGLRQAGIRQAIATSKPAPLATRIIEHLQLADYFGFVGGDTDDGSRGTKAMVIDHVLDRFGRPDPSGVLMVGDRRQDVEGARAHGIECVGAGWGYAAPGELDAAGAAVICSKPDEVAALFAAGAR